MFLRTPGPNPSRHPVTPYFLVDGDGRVVQEWSGKGSWYRLWLQTLAGAAHRVFLISDSRFSLAYITPMGDDRFHVMHLMHNTHTLGERRWDSPLSTQYGPLLESIRHLDGLVTLDRPTARGRG